MGVASPIARLPRGLGRSGIALAAALTAAVGGGALIAVARAGGDPPASPGTAAAFERATGVRIVRVAVTAGGGLLDVRYSVVDRERGHSLHDAARPLTVVEPRSGTRLVAAGVHGAHGAAELPPAGTTAYTLLRNTGTAVRRGSTVTVTLAGARQEGVVVQ